MVAVAYPGEAAAARQKLLMENGAGYFSSPYLSAQTAMEPDAKLIEQDPNTTNRAHFHQVNQFQVFVAGGGKLGRVDVAPIVVQYAAAFTPYGPIIAGDAGVSYLTLREYRDPGIRHLPEGYRDLKHEPRRNVVGQPWRSGNHMEDVAEFAMIDQQADGLQARLFRLEAGVGWCEPTGEWLSPRYLVVLKGEVACAEKPLGRYGCIFARANEPLPALAVLSHKTEIIVMTFPVAVPKRM